MRRRGGAGVWGVLVACCAASCGGATQSTTDGSANDVAGDVPAATDISGWFMVTSYATGDCGATAPSPLGPAYVWVEKQVSRYVVHACPDMVEADCTGTLFYDFTQPIENGSHAEGGSAFYSAGCTLTVERTDLTVVAGALHAKSLTDSVNDNRAEAQCTLDAALQLTAPCTYETDLDGTRL